MAHLDAPRPLDDRGREVSLDAAIAVARVLSHDLLALEDPESLLTLDFPG